MPILTSHPSPAMPSIATTSLSGQPSLRNFPVSLFGAVVGLAGLALAWRLASRSLGVPASIGEAIGAFSVAVFSWLLPAIWQNL